MWHANWMSFGITVNVWNDTGWCLHKGQPDRPHCFLQNTNICILEAQICFKSWTISHTRCWKGSLWNSSVDLWWFHGVLQYQAWNHEVSLPSSREGAFLQAALVGSCLLSACFTTGGFVAVCFVGAMEYRPLYLPPSPSAGALQTRDGAGIREGWQCSTGCVHTI